MDDYNLAAERSAKAVTNTFSTSFSWASRFFAKEIRQDIYNIYGLVRLADEVVDGYKGEGAEKILNDLETEVYRAIRHGFSSNLIVQAYANTARKVGISKTVIAPFFESMRTDLTATKHTKASYEQYIYGSAEVVGLMCLSVFVDGDHGQYQRLETGAKALGSAFQKVNFLRDVADDHNKLGRMYFPGVKFETFDDHAKEAVENDIARDFQEAKKAILLLPDNSRTAVAIAYEYFRELNNKISRHSASEIKQNRVRLNDAHKIWLMLKTWITQR
jgi:phytoene/squalene synthetase